MAFLFSILLINRVDALIILFIWEILLLSKLISVLKSRYAYLLFIHPLFIFVNLQAFQIPFTEIGVGFSFIGKFDMFFDSENGGGNETMLALLSGNIFETYSDLYLSSLPIVAIKVIFEKFPDIGYFVWLNVFHLFCITIAAVNLFAYRSLTKNAAVIIVLCFLIAPSFLEINSTLHRYSLLFTGITISFNSINYLYSEVKDKKTVFFYISFVFSIILILISKPALIISPIIFWGILFLNKRKIQVDLLFFIIIFIIITDLFGSGLLNQFGSFSRYSEVNKTGGNSFSFLALLFGVGFFFRLLYAALSPFPWIGFSQSMDLYGGNNIFLFIHIFSAITSLFLLLSFFINIKRFKVNKLDSNSIIFGFALLLPLRFSSIGFHVYLVPALPFLSPILLHKQYRIPAIFVLLLILIMEILLCLNKNL